MDLNNFTYSVGDFNLTTGGAFPVFSILGPLSLLWIIIANILLLVSVLSSATLRSNLRVQLIVCMAVSDLTTGVLSTGIFSYIAVTKFWNLGCPFHYLVQILGVFADIFLTTWYLVVFNATFFIDLMHLRLPQLSPLGDKLFRTLVIISPVILFCIICLPIIFSRPGDVRPTSAAYCPLFLETPYEIAMAFICFFVPATSLVIFCVTFIIFRNEKTIARETLARNLLENPGMIERPLYFLLPSLSVVVMGLPDQLVALLFFTSQFPSTKGLGGMFMTFAALEVLRQAVLPMSWLIFPDIRQAFKDRLNCAVCKRTKSPMTVTNFTYRNLQND